MQPRASIIIVSYNRKQDVLRCLQSVNKTRDVTFEVIVVDNASSDCTADTLATECHDITLICSSTNLGFAGGCNLGARHARGEYLVFLNQDTTVDPGWLGALLRALDSDTDVGLVTSKILMLHQPERINACGNSVHITGLTLCRGLGAPSTSFTEEEEVDSVSGAAFAIRRNLFDTLRGFDETTFLYMEDIDLSLRARLAGAASSYVPDSVVFHDYSFKVFPLKVYYQERNRYLMLLKSLRWLTILALVPALIAAEAIAWGFVILYDRSNAANKIRAYDWVLENWWLIMDARREVQSKRAIRDHELLRHTSFRLELDQARQTAVAKIGQRLLDPFFWVLRRITLLIVRW